MFSLKLGIDLIAGATTGVTVGTIAPTYVSQWPLTVVSLGVSILAGLLAGFVYYRRVDS